MIVSRKIVVVSALLVIIAGGGLIYKLKANQPAGKITSPDGTVLEFENSEFAGSTERSSEKINQSNESLGLTERDGPDGICPNNFSVELADGRTVCTHGSD